MSEGTGWVGDGEFTDVAYSSHANAKLTSEQKEAIAASGESESQWIREAVEERLARERGGFHVGLHSYKLIPDIDRAILYLKLKRRMIQITDAKEKGTTPKLETHVLSKYEEAIGLPDIPDTKENA
jgi:hypothetical protein